MIIKRPIKLISTKTIFSLLAPAIIVALILPVPASTQEGYSIEKVADLSRQNSKIWRSLTSRSVRNKTIGEYAAELESMATLLDDSPVAVATVIELDATLTPETKKSLAESGIVIEEYLGGSVYLVSSKPSSDMSGFSAALSSLSATGGALDPADKISPAARLPMEVPAELDAEAGQATPSLTVEFLSVVSDTQARSSLSELGIEVIRKLDEHTYVVSRGTVGLETIAEVVTVKSVDIGPVPFYPLNATGRRVAESDQAQLFSLGGAAPIYGGVTGAGVQIGIADSGVDGAHDDFDSVQGDGTAGASRVYNSRPGSGGHGTHVASIAGGSGVNSDANSYPAFSLRGQAPEAQIGDYSQMGSTAANYHAAIVGDGTDVTNHSYVQSMNGYGSEARAIDRIVRGDAQHNGDNIPPRPQVWAAGNNGTGAQYGNEEGYYALFTSAKNTISVGSIDTRDMRVSDFSSLGPTFDGRIKPDIMAPGCNDSIGAGTRILAALNNSQGYTGKCGTSMAAPVVTGIVALMMDGYTDAFGVPPSLKPSSYKAILVQTARDMVKTTDFSDREFNNPDSGNPIHYHAGPDFATGYGLVDAAGAVNAIQKARKLRESTVGVVGEVDTYCVNVPAGAGEFKATLAWDDEPGSTITTSTTKKLVNDLDLELIAPDGTVVRPWTLDPLPMTANPGDGALDPIDNSDVVPARRDVDRRNNVEMANVALPAAGRWRVRVTAFNLPNANPQNYSLATSEPIRPFCFFPPGAFSFCQLFPQFCKIKIPRDPIPVGPDWRQPVPVPEICKYVINCPGCEHVGPNNYCPGWDIQMSRLPRNARIVVFDGTGKIISTSRRNANQRIRLRKWKPGDDRYIAVVNPAGGPYRRGIKPEIRVQIDK